MKYLCYDSALNEEYTLIILMKRYPRHISLFAGTDDEGIWDAAPWLFTVKDNFYELQGQMLIQLEHCTLFETKDLLKDVCDFLHTKMYRQVNDRQEYYRIWDARVLLKYLDECNDIDRQSFFQVFDAVYTEANAAELYKWTLQANGRVANVLISKAEALPVIPDEEPEEDDDEPVTAGAGEKTPVEAPSRQDEGNEMPPASEEKPKRRKFFID